MPEPVTVSTGATIAGLVALAVALVEVLKRLLDRYVWKTDKPDVQVVCPISNGRMVELFRAHEDRVMERVAKMRAHMVEELKEENRHTLDEVRRHHRAEEQVFRDILAEQRKIADATLELVTIQRERDRRQGGRT